jgi:flagellar motor switch protein FliN
MPDEVNIDPVQNQADLPEEAAAAAPPESSSAEAEPGSAAADEHIPTFEELGMFRKPDDDDVEEGSAAAGDNQFPDLSGVASAPAFAQRAEFQQLAPAAGTESFHNNIDLLLDVKMPVAIELGRTELPIAELLALGPGSVIELNKLAGEPVDLLVNNKIIARGEVVVVDENFGVRVTSLLSPEERIKSLAME